MRKLLSMLCPGETVLVVCKGPQEWMLTVYTTETGEIKGSATDPDKAALALCEVIKDAIKARRAGPDVLGW